VILSVTAENLNTLIQTTPEAGQLVEVRRRHWIVSDVKSSGLSIKQHLVSLSSIEEDALGETLDVIWEIEPGAHIVEKAGLPSISGQDKTTELEAFLDAVRWGAATNADRGFLQAPFRSGISIEDFQLDPLVRAIDMARANLLIADDVGLGKTIEAGLVIQELILRHRARSVFIVCPASLQEKWRLEMQEKFGLEFKIVNTVYIKELRRKRGIHANPWSSFPRLIVSMDWMKAGEAMRLLREILPVNTSYPRKFDILVVDEAHNVAPSGSKNYALDSQRTRLIRTLSPHFQHRLFLTATPHNGYTESFTSLLELLDNQRFSRNILPDEKQLSQVMVRRLKTELVDKQGNPLYPKRKLQALEIPYSTEERSIHRLLNDYCSSRESSCKGRQVIGTKFVNSLLKKRLFSSPAAFASTLGKHYDTLTSEEQPTQKDPLIERILRKAILKAEEDYADDNQSKEAQEEAIIEITKYSAPLTQNEESLLKQMRSWAQKERNRTDSKARAIIDWIKTNLQTLNGDWNDRRVILFTEYRDTHTWLHEILTTQGYGDDRLSILHGGIDQEEREVTKAAFQTNPNDAKVRILLATDAASEGIDLQNYCNCLIHLEIPYNPNVMEQRNGRIDRHGQKASEVLIWHPVDGGSAKSDTVGGHKNDILRALKKLESMREDMGNVNPVIAPQMSGLIEGSITNLHTKEVEAKLDKTKKALIKANRNIKERIESLHNKLEETQKDFHLTPDRIQQAVEAGLKLADKPALKPYSLENTPTGSVFKMPTLTGSWAKCLEGLSHPHTGKIRPITFDHDVAKGRDDIVLVHLNHCLVQMCLRLMRAEVWAKEDSKKLHRIDIRSLPDSELAEPAVITISRLVITGGHHHRLHEELIASGGYLKESGFVREVKIGTIDKWREIAIAYYAEEELFTTLKNRFEQTESNIQKAIEARSKERLRNLRNTLQRKEQQEINNITQVLDELAQSIENEFKTELEPLQLDLFGADEKTQIHRDNEALKARLAEIPKEKEQEKKNIQQHYANLIERTFPVAVIFLTPESYKGEQV